MATEKNLTKSESLVIVKNQQYSDKYTNPMSVLIFKF